MPIEILCNECGTQLRVDDSAAGRKAKCPKCSTILPVPSQNPTSFDGAREFESPPGPSSSNPFARSSAEQPVDYNSYPQNPYATSSISKPIKKSGEVDLSTVFSFAWIVFADNVGLLLGVSVTLGVISGFDNGLDFVAQNTNDGAIILFCSIASIVLMLFSLFLGIGQTRIALKLCRGQQASYGDLFEGGDRFLKVFGYVLLITVPLLMGFLLLLIPGFILLAIYWPTYVLIVDRKTGVFDSFPLSHEMGLANLGSSSVLLLASLGIFILGLLSCGVGLLFTSAYTSVMWATAYLMMTGEIGAGALGPQAEMKFHQER